MNPLNETPQTRLKSLEQSLITSSFDTTHVYIHLLKSSLNLDLSIGTLPEIQSPSESISPTTLSKNLPALSEESKANLNLWASRWKLSEAFCVLAFLEVVYEFYVEWRVPGWVVVGGYEEIYVEMKKDATWLSEYEVRIYIYFLFCIHIFGIKFYLLSSYRNQDLWICWMSWETIFKAR